MPACFEQGTHSSDGVRLGFGKCRPALSRQVLWPGSPRQGAAWSQSEPTERGRGGRDVWKPLFIPCQVPPGAGYGGDMIPAQPGLSSWSRTRAGKGGRAAPHCASQHPSAPAWGQEAGPPAGKLPVCLRRASFFPSSHGAG